MVFLSNFFNPSTLFDVDKYFNEVFYSLPDKGKPPWVCERVVEDGKVMGLNIFMALAGMGEEHIKCYEENGYLIVDVNNKDTQLPDKFIIDKKIKFSLTDSFDLSSDKVVVDLSNGMLSIFIPLKEKKMERKMLFGK
jgi:HSP20 family molecular chaperone IbpA